MSPRRSSRSARRVNPPLDISRRSARSDMRIPLGPASPRSARTLYSAMLTFTRASPASMARQRRSWVRRNPSHAACSRLLSRSVATTARYRPRAAEATSARLSAQISTLGARDVSWKYLPAQTSYRGRLTEPAALAASERNEKMAFEIGIMTFGEITEDPVTGTRPSPRQRAREVIELAEVADQAGLDVFGVGEHHRGDFVGSAPTILLAAAAEKTERIRLTSSVTVLSSEDPVRVWEQFATIDLLSRGRAEIIAGRGSYSESFPLFGYALNDYADLFREKLDLLLAIRKQNPLTWSGRLRPELVDADISPRADGDTIPIWVGVG